MAYRQLCNGLNLTNIECQGPLPNSKVLWDTLAVRCQLQLDSTILPAKQLKRMRKGIGMKK